MDESMLSQEEIDALLGLNNDDDDFADSISQPSGESLEDNEKDILGEISNISMGTAATTLSSLVNQKVWITTPTVDITTWDQLSERYEKPSVAIQVEYKEGLIGTNLLMLKQNDVKIITDLMMGGDGTNINLEEELNDLHLSAICEAMNQMVGSSSTSLFSLFNKKIDILPPVATVIDFEMSEVPDNLNEDVAAFLKGNFVAIQFNMVIGDVIDSAIMQLYPIKFAKDMCDNLMNAEESNSESIVEENNQISQQEANMTQPPQMQPEQNNMYQQSQQPMQPQQPMQYQQYQQPVPPQQPMQYNNQIPNQFSQSSDIQRNVDVQPAQFQNFDVASLNQQKENIDLIMDVPLEITVELGRTKRPIKEILEFSPGTVIELDKLAGDPIDIMVNGKLVAKGEVVVIDEYFSIRVTEIISRRVLF